MMSSIQQTERARASLGDELGKPLVARESYWDPKLGWASDWKRRIVHESHRNNDAA